MYAYYGSFLCVSTRTRRQWPIMIQIIFPSSTPHNNTHTPLPSSSLPFRYAHISVSCTIHLSVPLAPTWLSPFSPPLLPRIRTPYLFAIHHHDDGNAPSLSSISHHLAFYGPACSRQQPPSSVRGMQFISYFCSLPSASIAPLLNVQIYAPFRGHTFCSFANSARSEP